MARVIHLFAPKAGVSNAADEGAPLTAPMRVAIADIVSSIRLLPSKIRELETHLDNLERVISHLRDPKMRQALQDLVKVHRESLIEATRELALQVRKLQDPVQSAFCRF